MTYPVCGFWMKTAASGRRQEIPQLVVVIDRLLRLQGEHRAAIGRVVDGIGAQRDVRADPDTQVGCAADNQIMARP
jgi:hypothetical protein